MEIATFGKAIGIGLAIAAPVGPMAILCMRRTLASGPRAGLATGLGIASGDGIYALVAALGLASIARFMLAYDRPLHIIAGLFLLYLGVRTFFAREPAETATPLPRQSALAGYGSALLLTLTNPPTIISFAAIFTVLAPASGFDVRSALITVAGVFAGSTLWWIILTAAVSLARHALGARTRRIIDRLSGGVLALFGAAELRRA
jgi:threonine/homoserine/homoserine lactone efflux protein